MAKAAKPAKSAEPQVEVESDDAPHSQQGRPRHPEAAEAPAADQEVHPDTHNPKINPNTASNAIKDPDEWASGDEPMTGAQASYLKTLSEEAKEPDAFSEDLSKAEASKRIDAMRAKLHRG